MNNTLKVFSVKEEEITYTFYNVSKNDFYYVESENAVAFQRGTSDKMFILNKTISSQREFDELMRNFFNCDEIKVKAK